MAVIDNAFETKGSHLYFVDSLTTTDPTVTQLSCPTGITGVNGGTKDTIDTTCLSNITSKRTSIGGFADTSDVSVPFILYAGDGSHQALFTLQEANSQVNWMVGLSDSANAPTVDTDNLLVPPPDRTTFQFDATISNLTIDLATNEVVRGTMTLKPSGATTVHWAV